MLKSLRKVQWIKSKIFSKEVPLLLFILSFIFLLSCTHQEEVLTNEENLLLGFSADTVIFDTVFTSVGSLTKRLKIYNKNKKAVNIKDLSLGQSSASSYNLKVFGEEGYGFKDVFLRGGDSLLLLVTVNIDPQNQNLPFLVKDSIVFKTNNLQQDIKLVAFGQDAHFFNDSILACNTTWTADRPYLIYNSVLVDTLCNLTIEKGAKIYFNSKAKLWVRGTLKAEGDPDNKIIFTNDRWDGPYKNAPGQWGGLEFLVGSKDNVLNHTIIRNAVDGIKIGTPDDDIIPDLYISNSIIENMSSVGIEAYSSDIMANNVLINNCGEFTVANLAGGSYTYNHCTFANFNYTFIRDKPSIVFSDNYVVDNQTILEEDIVVNLHNSIIWGSQKEEIILSHSGRALFMLNSSYNILRSLDSALNINNNILNSTEFNFPKFKDPEGYNYSLDTLSPAKDVGNPSSIDTDLLGQPRGKKPDIGAYERIE
ncbi:MAG: right-handed parallel beta-helix repeat-containing protein [Bacteroidota bacterium]|nr:right-handed parallel beta-helix repeat-containing protein [Bacteroidota bacterium]